MNVTPVPAYPDVSTVPLILAQRRLTNIRRKQLLKAAAREYDDPPPPPKPDECCASSCDPCVKTLWKEELACWEQRWGRSAASLTNALPKATVSKQEAVSGQRKTTSMPGAFDW